MSRSGRSRARHKLRVLAVDPHIRRVAFAVIHRDALLDWGTRNTRVGRPTARITDAIVPTLVGLLDKHAPHVLLVPSITRGRWAKRRTNTATAILALAGEAMKRGVSVHSLSNEEVKNSVEGQIGRRVRNVVDLHDAVVQRFPELRVLFPRARRLWDGEPYSVRLFNAVGMYLAWRHRRE